MKLLLITCSLLLSSLLVNAQVYLDNTEFQTKTTAQVNKNGRETASEPAYIRGNQFEEVDGIPEHLEEYVISFCENVNNRNVKKIAPYMKGAQKYKEDTKAMEGYIDNFWCGYEEGKKYNGKQCILTNEIKNVEVVSHRQIGNSTYVIKHKVETKKKVLIVELVMELSSSYPQYIGTI